MPRLALIRGKNCLIIIPWTIILAAIFYKVLQHNLPPIAIEEPIKPIEVSGPVLIYE